MYLNPLPTSLTAYSETSASSHDTNPATEEDDVDEDPLMDIARMAPLGKMVSQAEAAKARSMAGGRTRAMSLDMGNESRRKRSRTDAAIPESSQPSSASEHHFDPIESGICSESQARRLVEVWYFGIVSD